MPNTNVTSRSMGVPSIIMRRVFSLAPSSDSPKDDLTSARTARKHANTTTERVDVGSAPHHVEAKQSEDRRDHDPLQSVVATRDMCRAVHEVEQDHVEAQCHHQQADPVQAAHDPTRGQTREAGRQASDEQATDGLSPTVLAEEPSGIRTDPEEGGVAKRRDAAVAEASRSSERANNPQIRICDNKTRLLFGMKNSTSQPAQKANSHGLQRVRAVKNREMSGRVMSNLSTQTIPADATS